MKSSTMTWNSVEITNFHKARKYIVTAITKKQLKVNSLRIFRAKKKRNHFENWKVLSRKIDIHDCKSTTPAQTNKKIKKQIELNLHRKFPRVNFHKTARHIVHAHSTQIYSYDIHWIDEKSDLVAINIAGNTYTSASHWIEFSKKPFVEIRNET